MSFDDLDASMRIYETARDYCVLPTIYMVARLDGRGFTRLTKDICEFEAPFDVRFRDLMLGTTEALMNAGFRIRYGYTQSDEISLLFDRDDGTFNRKTRKLVSVLAAEASSVFSLALGQRATFDCRISELPNLELVTEYFRWRAEDAHRNALNAHCYWTLRHSGMSVGKATSALEGVSVAAKNELLFAHGINFADLPAWQRRGAGLIWETYAKAAINPKTGQSVEAQRRRLRRELELPVRDGYATWLRQVVAA
ncbi:MAG TPA: tRNA(His) guanylyltransferase Thg1 family protein [Kofleriaceae bacterium]|nr:tRNA(His) guanylyltransferase Thg1 family protein [Kofleriaceae bacterium]